MKLLLFTFSTFINVSVNYYYLKCQMREANNKHSR